MPPDHLIRERLDAVLAVVYLIFNEGYGGRDELVAEAIWLGRALAELLPNNPEVRGLLAMMLLPEAARAPTRALLTDLVARRCQLLALALILLSSDDQDSSAE
ncbi:DUF6596 domain-containing protein [Nonomuraea solani]|uniref:DUF6596 domain-containing protein n=1 Tax=Nonomuraea solani TaxID=1144553 RepID=UPI00190EAE97|nr:DUF6596 domain-containing protein [Nonomuraea solani]